MQDLNCGVAVGLSGPGAMPPGAGSGPPVALPVWPGRRFVDLVSDSLRDVAGRDCDGLYLLMANAIVQHLTAEVQGGDARRLAEEAMDRMLSLVSKDLHRQIAGARSGQAADPGRFVRGA
jgi:hypothetical protein